VKTPLVCAPQQYHHSLCHAHSAQQQRHVTLIQLAAGHEVTGEGSLDR
jgi:hypothetical protein